MGQRGCGCSRRPDRMRARRLLLIASAPLLWSSQAASSAQNLSAPFASLARYPAETAEPLRSCGTPADQLLRTQLAVGEPMADGDALRADQFPRFLTPAHAGNFGFDVFTVLGDHETVTFERRDPSQASSVTVETGTRTGTSSIAGRLTSIFRPVWPAEVLSAALAGERWGVDRPYLFWGDVVAPGTARQPCISSLHRRTSRRRRWSGSATRCSLRAMQSISGSPASVMRVSRAVTRSGISGLWRRRSISTSPTRTRRLPS